MKKTLLFTLIFITFQKQLVAQTQTETLDWIISKIKSYGNLSDQKIIYITDKGIINWTTTDHFKDQTNEEWDLTTVTGVSGWNPGSNLHKDCIALFISPYKTIPKEKDEYDYGPMIWIKLSWSSEKNLKERFIKACNKLGEYNLLHFKKEAF